MLRKERGERARRLNPGIPSRGVGLKAGSDTITNTCHVERCKLTQYTSRGSNMWWVLTYTLLTWRAMTWRALLICPSDSGCRFITHQLRGCQRTT